MEVSNISEAVKSNGVASVLDQMAKADHEQILFCQDQATGLKALIAIHNTTLGPSLGGTRMWKYSNEAEALHDVLRLSKGMTYKSAISGLNLGGGKAVIIGDSKTQKSEALMRKFGRFVDSLGGKYITAEDVGISTRDMEYVAMETDHVAGLPKHLGGTGDPSPVTAFGVDMGMKASAKKAYGSDNLEGKRVLVQGAGHVGQYLIDMLIKENATVLISDIDTGKIADVITKHKNVQAINVNEVYTAEMDIYAPCALGATINDETLNTLSCDIIAGAANNQLEDEIKHGRAVKDLGKIYAPDFLINAGGIMNCYAEVQGYGADAAMQQAEGIYQTTLDIFEKSESENIPTYLAANQLAEARLNAIAKVHTNL